MKASKRAAVNPTKHTIVKGDEDKPFLPVLVKYLLLISTMKLVCIGYDEGPRSRFC